MGFMDKVKATAEKVGEKAQQGVQQGQQKLSDAQERKRVDGLLRDLGAACYHDRTGRGAPVITSEIERLTAALREAEAGGATIDLKDGAASGDAGDDTPPGSYTLDDV
jgi:hypothetical protein